MLPRIPIRSKAITVFVFVLGTAIITGCTSRTYDETAIFVENAKLREAAPLTAAQKASDKTQPRPVPENIAVTGHRITKGHGVILGTRAFETAFRYFPPVDYAIFKKLTIYLPWPLASIDGEVDLTAPDVIVFWSDAGVTGRQLGCIGFLGAGNLRVLSKTATVVTVDADIKISLRPEWSGKGCEPVRIKGKFEFARVDLDNLTPWQGGGQIRPGDEFFPTDEIFPSNVK